MMNEFEQTFRTFLNIFFVIVILVALIFFGPLPTYLDNEENTVAAHEPYLMSDHAAALHKTIAVADLHSDSLLWRRDIEERHSYGHVDLPRLMDGNVALQVFDIVTKSPAGQNFERNSGASDLITVHAMMNLWPYDSLSSLKERALYQASKLHDVEKRSNGMLKVVTSSSSLRAVMAERAAGKYTVAGLLGLEGAHALDRGVSNLDALADAGITIYGLTHFFDNFLAGSAHGLKKGGLTTQGRDLVRALEARSLIIDLAHLAPTAIDDVLALATRPVIVSHTGVKGTCDRTRNISDAHLDKIATGGGLVGIGLWEEATCGDDLKSAVMAMKYVADRVGVDHVALGSDWDGTIHAFIDVSETAAITQMLIDEGFSDSDITKIMGGNTIRFMLENLPD